MSSHVLHRTARPQRRGLALRVGAVHAVLLRVWRVRSGFWTAQAAALHAIHRFAVYQWPAPHLRTRPSSPIWRWCASARSLVAQTSPFLQIEVAAGSRCRLALRLFGRLLFELLYGLFECCRCRDLCSGVGLAAGAGLVFQAWAWLPLWVAAWAWAVAFPLSAQPAQQGVTGAVCGSDAVRSKIKPSSTSTP